MRLATILRFRGCFKVIFASYTNQLLWHRTTLIEDITVHSEFLKCLSEIGTVFIVSTVASDEEESRFQDMVLSSPWSEYIDSHVDNNKHAMRP